ncbi:MAG: CbtA family protein [bacterium]
MKAALVSGLVAGAAVAIFHLVLIEPVIERAIQLEHQSARPQEPVTMPVVSRATQRWGLAAGLLLFGMVWGILFGLLAYLSRAWQPQRWSAARWGFLLALATGWTVSLLPFLKYPANPPGVGEPETIGYRQGLYFGFVALSVVGTALAAGLYRRLHRTAALSEGYRPWIGPVAYALYATAAFTLMPSNPDPVRMPVRLIWTFRAISFSALILFWMILGGVFGRLFQTDASGTHTSPTP